MARKSRKSGFTLAEIMATLVIVGILASIAMPRYQTVVERTRSSEGIQIITALLGAQKRFALENNGNFSAVLGALDIDIPLSPNFDPPQVFNEPTPPDAAVSIDRNDGSYTLSVDADGTISCTGDALLCQKMGY